MQKIDLQVIIHCQPSGGSREFPTSIKLPCKRSERGNIASCDIHNIYYFAKHAQKRCFSST